MAASTSYIMENDKEVARLEKMTQQATYQPSREATKLTFKAGMKVLDAGCGSGTVARYIADHYPGVTVEGCDLSAVRMEQAREVRKREGKQDIRYFVSPLEKIAADDNTYDRITCRYVFEFLENPVAVLKEFLRVLKPGGQALVIQFDGFLFNYHHKNKELAEMLRVLEAKGPFDAWRGRKLPSMFLEAGFQKMDWDVEVFGFKGKELIMEQEQQWERLDFGVPMLTQVFGSKEKAEKLRDMYAKEMTEPGSVLFYNKFFVWGAKP